MMKRLNPSEVSFEVLEEIHRSDESIGEQHGPRPVREPAAERRRMARKEPNETR